MYAIPVLLFSLNVFAAKFDCSSLSLKPLTAQTLSHSPLGDFAFRDILPQTEKPAREWQTCCGSFGPCALPYPKVNFPRGADHVEWSRIRVTEAAKKWTGLPYKHHHFPAMGGLDCSNFTAFVYNYALGVSFTSNIEKQALKAGRRLHPSEKSAPGDLIFLYSGNFSRISHVAIYLNPAEVIDSTGPGVQIRANSGWYKQNFAWARRIIE